MTLHVHPKEAHLQMALGEGIFQVLALLRPFSLFQAPLSPSSHYLIRFFSPTATIPQLLLGDLLSDICVLAPPSSEECGFDE